MTIDRRSFLARLAAVPFVAALLPTDAEAEPAEIEWEAVGDDRVRPGHAQRPPQGFDLVAGSIDVDGRTLRLEVESVGEDGPSRRMTVAGFVAARSSQVAAGTPCFFRVRVPGAEYSGEGVVSEADNLYQTWPMQWVEVTATGLVYRT